MLYSTEMRELLKQTAEALAEWPPQERAWYVTYLLELLESQAGKDETQAVLETVSRDIDTRLTSGRW